ncbi:SulP family inorganic anion transporter [Ornithobacterium rhinotracheale]|uniref:SulP family inorganic anion transporter n=1 Tax=Ornithobacterium rhinotracheale TaxID=28251 RepID=UPI00129C3394|nr:SulP family inorganic anion transporter [Ornithobacterium rhinotracheale]MRJ07583.1 SulP family inorganic anion transporter [Ornithobacterium rhinotracheale]UOH78182.1 SulP family inorganic anion transporter [Ornithobacterium rhinotracheale]
MNLLQDIKTNFASGLVVFLVALPLCLGIALASGAPSLSGVIAGIVGGIVIGYLSTSHISVSGPAAGLTAIVWANIQELGAFELFLCAGVLAGIIQLILGFVRAGSIAEYIPSSVIEGMLAGIGVIIAWKQLPNVFGYQVSEPLFESFGLNPAFLAEFTSKIQFGAIFITLISLFVLIVWDKIPFLKNIKMLPAALIVVILGVLINQYFVYSGSAWALSSNNLVQLPVPSSFEDFKGLVVLPNFEGFLNPAVWVAGATIAVVASVETLLCVEAADRMDEHRRITDTNQELRAQGIGNIISSMVGGLPMTSVVVRSSANANAGATSKMSAIIHGFLLLICVLTIPVLLNMIPQATLAAVLLLVGYKLAKPSTIMHFWHKGKYQFVPFIVTMIGVVTTDLLKGVMFGLAVAIVSILVGNMKRAYYYSKSELKDADSVKIVLAQEVSFLNKAAIKKTLKNIQPNSEVTIDARKTTYISTDVLELIQDFANVFAKENNIEVLLYGFKTNYEDEFENQHSNIILHHRRSM